MKHLIHMFLPAILALLAGFGHYQYWFQSFDFFIYDKVQQHLSAKSNGETLIIAIDEQSIEKLGRWPWPRKVHAELLQKLNSVNPKAIVFDILFASPDSNNPGNDQLLANAIKDSGNVILPMYFDVVHEKGQLIEVPPIPDFFQHASAIGHAHIGCDEDGICRSVYLQEGLGAPHWPHVSLALLQNQNLSNTGRIPGARSRLDIESSHMLLYRDYLNYIPFGKHYQIPTISYADILNNKIPLDRLKNKVIYIGATAAGVHDILTTPIGRLPGVKIGAIIYEQLIEGNLIQPIDQNISAFFIALGVFLLLYLISHLSPLHFLLSSLLAALVLATSNMFLIKLCNFWFPSSSALFSILIFYPLWSWFRLEIALSFLTRNLKLAESSNNNIIPFKKQLFSSPSKHINLVSGSEIVSQTILRLYESNQDLEAQRQLLQQTIDNFNEVFFLFDEDINIVLYNKAAKEEFKSAQLSSSVIEVLSDLQIKNEQKLKELLTELLKNKGVFQVEALLPAPYSHTRLDAIFFIQGQAITIERQSLTIKEKSHSFNIGVLTLTNISGIKQAEQSRLETLNFISHDLRSPLVSVIALIKNARRKEYSSDVENLLNKIENYTFRNLEFAESLLQLNRAEASNYENFQLCDLHAIVDAAYSQVLAIAKEKPIQLSMLKDDKDFWVVGDHSLLERAVINLLTNAIKFSLEDGFVELHLKQKQDNSNIAEVKVVDNGPGIDERDLPKVFQRFKRLSVTQQTSGAGLGLFFVQTVAQKHKGSALVKSSLGQGSTFSIKLPVVSINPNN